MINYLQLSKWNPFIHTNYFHLYNNCLIHIATFMELNNLKNNNTYLNIHKSTITIKNKYFNEILLKFVSGISYESSPQNNIIIVDIEKYCSNDSLYKKLQSIYNIENDIENKITFIKRRTRRILLNEQECINLLKQKYSHKYEILDVFFEDLSIEDQVKIMSNSVLTIGAHGAGLTNLYYSPSGSNVLEIFPESFYYDCYKNICEYKHIKYNCIHGKDLNKPKITLEKYLEKPSLYNRKFRKTIRDVSFFVDEQLFIKKIDELLYT